VEFLQAQVLRAAAAVTALTLLRQPQHAYALRGELDRCGLEITEGALYALLDQLQERGLLDSARQEHTVDGPKRRIFWLTDLGRAQSKLLGELWGTTEATLRRLDATVPRHAPEVAEVLARRKDVEQTPRVMFQDVKQALDAEDIRFATHEADKLKMPAFCKKYGFRAPRTDGLWSPEGTGPYAARPLCAAAYARRHADTLVPSSFVGTDAHDFLIERFQFTYYQPQSSNRTDSSDSQR
jgi:DNA-binding PadR family transcriptional regulator